MSWNCIWNIFRLQTLWVNFNQIEKLFPWIDNLSHSFDQIKYLSMMGNQAAPRYLLLLKLFMFFKLLIENYSSFINAGPFHDYLLYR